MTGQALAFAEVLELEQMPAWIADYQLCTHGRRYSRRFDYAWPAFRIAIDFEGSGWRPGAPAVECHCARLRGWLVLPASSHGEALERLRAAFAARGLE